MSYRASLTSKLSIRSKSQPFETLEEFADSKYRLILPVISLPYQLIFSIAEPGTLEHKVFQKRIPGIGEEWIEVSEVINIVAKVSSSLGFQYL